MPHITHVINILNSIFSNAEFYINNHQMDNLNELHAHKSHISNSFNSALTDYKGVLPCEAYDYEEDSVNLLECPFFSGRLKLYSRPDGFMLTARHRPSYNIGITTSKYESMNQTFLSTTKFIYDKRESQCLLGYCGLFSAHSALDAQIRLSQKENVSTRFCSS